LLSKLLANALTLGAQNTPVKVEAFHKDGYFELSVLNQDKLIKFGFNF